MTTTRLTSRHRDVLDLIADGHTNGAIARKLGIGEQTVRSHIEAIRERLGATNRAHAVAQAFRAGEMR